MRRKSISSELLMCVGVVCSILLLAMSVSFCLPHPVAVSAFIICVACVLVLRWCEYVCSI